MHNKRLGELQAILDNNDDILYRRYMKKDYEELEQILSKLYRERDMLARLQNYVQIKEVNDSIEAFEALIEYKMLREEADKIREQEKKEGKQKEDDVGGYTVV